MKRFALFFALFVWEIGFLMNIPGYKDTSSTIAALFLMLLPVIILIGYRKLPIKKNHTDSLKKFDDNIIHQQHYDQQQTPGACKAKNLPRFNLNSQSLGGHLNIHPDIINMIWIGDGNFKNYQADTKSVGNNIYLQCGSEEPSVIYLNLAISKPINKESVPKPDYYPSYVGLSPEQRWVYWEFLSNPYNPNVDIGYVFLFYYGLERFILKKIRNDAFYMLLKLRDIHKNGSFQGYTFDHLVYVCISKRRKDWAESLSELITKSQNINASPELIMIFKYQLSIPLYESDIVRYAGKFGFSNYRYIKMYPDLFSIKLKDLLINAYGMPYVSLNTFFNDDTIKKLKRNTLPVCANYSLSPREYKVPNIFSDEQFRLNILSKLQETHEGVKKELAIARKNK